ncbi:hypothetical protein CJ030_MR6G029212 [Morella rubra]|uniref:Uncharacterized protein n=1 Tax=Morella rubra TaxID=262757 RepID=A0A6A1V9Y3_9ROSI|nr:hypothetical protein CJ030_MR6G029212 [Morella rubra]
MLEELAQRVSNLRSIHCESENVYGEHMDFGGGVNINHGVVASMDTSLGFIKWGFALVMGARASYNALLVSKEVYMEELRDYMANKRQRNSLGNKG